MTQLEAAEKRPNEEQLVTVENASSKPVVLGGKELRPGEILDMRVVGETTEKVTPKDKAYLLEPVEEKERK